MPLRTKSEFIFYSGGEGPNGLLPVLRRANSTGHKEYGRTLFTRGSDVPIRVKLVEKPTVLSQFLKFVFLTGISYGR